MVGYGDMTFQLGGFGSIPIQKNINNNKIKKKKEKRGT